MGFSVARAEDTLVRYESGAVFVNIYHGRASCEGWAGGRAAAEGAC